MQPKADPWCFPPFKKVIRLRTRNHYIHSTFHLGSTVDEDYALSRLGATSSPSSSSFPYIYPIFFLLLCFTPWGPCVFQLHLSVVFTVHVYQYQYRLSIYLHFYANAYLCCTVTSFICAPIFLCACTKILFMFVMYFVRKIDLHVTI